MPCILGEANRRKNGGALWGTTYFEGSAIGAARETLGRIITEADIVIHAGQTGDFFPHSVGTKWSKCS